MHMIDHIICITERNQQCFMSCDIPEAYQPETGCCLDDLTAERAVTLITWMCSRITVYS